MFGIFRKKKEPAAPETPKVLTVGYIGGSGFSKQRLSENGKNLIKKFEGYSAKAYKPHADDVWTIGWGSTIGVKEGQVITEQVANEMFGRDVKAFENAVNDVVKVNLTQNQFDALVSLVYNIGIGNFKKSTLLRVLNKGEYEAASKEFAKWKYSSGKVYEGLVKRRAEEAKLFMS